MVKLDKESSELALDQLFQLAHYGIYFPFCVVLAEGKTNGDQVWIVVDGMNDMRPLVRTAGTGATA